MVDWPVEGGVEVEGVCTEEAEVAAAGCIAAVFKGLFTESEVLPAAVAVSSVPNVLSPLTVLVSSAAATAAVEEPSFTPAADGADAASDLALVAAFFAPLVAVVPFFDA